MTSASSAAMETARKDDGFAVHLLFPCGGAEPAGEGAGHGRHNQGDEKGHDQLQQVFQNEIHDGQNHDPVRRIQQKTAALICSFIVHESLLRLRSLCQYIT